MASGYGNCTVLGDGPRLLAFDLNGGIAVDRLGVVSADFDGLVVADRLALIVVDLFGSVVTNVDSESIADEVKTALLDLDIDQLNGRAGRQRSGYVKPTEAAWELLEEQLQPFLDDLKRHIALGFDGAAHAQSLSIGGSSANFGSTTLAPGFTPDPHETTITSGAI